MFACVSSLPGVEKNVFNLLSQTVINERICEVAVAPKIESLRFQDENDCKYEIQVKFACVLKKKPESFIFLFFFSSKNLVRLFIVKEVKPSPDSKMIKLLTFENLFLPLRHSR